MPCKIVGNKHAKPTPAFLDEHFRMDENFNLVRRSTGRIYKQEAGKQVFIAGHNTFFTIIQVLFMMSFRFDPRPAHVNRMGSKNPKDWELTNYAV
jgi:hypothetical protein